ncbi:MAG: hypothetical protein M3R49_12125 [Chloroflexota bacterium]|nr:hypothetical protein [Chloroflexota bacterium]
MPSRQSLARLYSLLGVLAEAAAEYDRTPVHRDEDGNLIRPEEVVDDIGVVHTTQSGKPELTTAAEFVAWLDVDVRGAAWALKRGQGAA